MPVTTLTDEPFPGHRFERMETRGSSTTLRNGQISSGAKAIVWSLEELGITDVFGIPGGNVMPLYDALMDSGTVRHTLARHEQGAGHAAAGYAAASGRIGAVIATSGPGATNLLTAIADAHFSSIPMLIITGQVSSNLIGTDAFQEADIVGMTTSITKHSFLVTAAEEIAPAIAKAHLLATTGRPGPVLVDITKDAQQAAVEFRWPGKVKLAGYRPENSVHKRPIGSAAQLIREAHLPVFLIGAGVIKADATSELRQLVELTGIPVITTPDARGAFPETDQSHLGISGTYGTRAAALRLWQSDLVLAIGTGLSGSATGRADLFCPNAKLIHADIDPTVISKVRVADVPIVGDAKEVFNSLLSTLAEDELTSSGSVPQPHFRAVHKPEEDDLLTPQYVIERIGALTGPEGTYVAGAGEHQAWTTRYLACDRPRSWLNSSTPGYGVPAAMGAKVSDPDRAVWAIDNARGFQMTNQELATCSVNQIPIKVAILRTSTSRVDQFAAAHHHKHCSAASNIGLHPDLVKLAEAYGALAIRITRRDEVEAAIQLSLDTNDRPVVLDFVVEWPDSSQEAP